MRRREARSRTERTLGVRRVAQCESSARVRYVRTSRADVQYTVAERRLRCANRWLHSCTPNWSGLIVPLASGVAANISRVVRDDNRLSSHCARTAMRARTRCSGLMNISIEPSPVPTFSLQHARHPATLRAAKKSEVVHRA